MSHLDCSIENRKGKHLTYEERIKLEALCRLGLAPACIAEQLGERSERTIRREISKGTVELLNSDLTTRVEYSAAVGQAEHDRRGTAKGPGLKIGKDHDLVKYLEKAIGKESQSPYAAIQNIANKGLKFETSICYKTVYNYLDNNLFLNISNKDLPVKKDSKKRNYQKIRQAYTNTKGTSISERPKEIDARDEIGHWEMDTVVGKQGTKTVLLVLSERVTREELIFKIPSKSQAAVVKELDKLERKIGKSFPEKFKTITCDNGGENLDFEGIERSARNSENRTKVYYAHPYSSWERGTNENTNKIIRRFIPKGVDISSFSDKEIKQIQHWINNYPRRILGGLSANRLIANKAAA
jgi:transposase, IS30 family